MADSLKTKLALLCIGTLLGAGFGLGAAKIITHYRGAVPEGAAFESVDDLRRAMLARDDRDVRADDSVSLRSIIAPDPSDLIIYRLKPNLDVKFEGARVRTNSFGLRGPETTAVKPEGTLRVALLGDSFAFGWGVEEEAIFARVMERRLSEQLGRRVEVLNFGVPGYSTFQEVALFEDLGPQFDPDAVLVYFIENDFGLPFFIKNFAKDGALVNNRHFHELKDESEDTEAEAGHNQLLKNLNSNRVLERFSKSCAEKNLPLFLVVNPGKNWDKTEKRLWVVRRDPNITFLPIRDEVSKIIDERKLEPSQLRLKSDPHPSDIKHEILGSVMAEKLVPYLVGK